MSAYNTLINALTSPSEVRLSEARRMVNELQNEMLRKAAAMQRDYGVLRYAIAADDGPSQRRKKESKRGVVEQLARVIDPDPPALTPRHVTVLSYPHADGWLVRWRLGNESKTAFRRGRDSADALADKLRAEAEQDARDAAAQAPHDDESLPLGAFVPCLNARCQRGEWSGKATERGWEQAGQGWLCPQCAADAADREDYLAALDAEGGESRE